MKKSIRKIIATFIAVLTIASSATLSFAAEEITTPADTGNSAVVIEETGDEITPRIDDIRWVYKYGADGNLYRRRFNYTTNSWVDAKWERVD